MKNLKEKSIDGVIWNLLEKIGIQLIRLVLGVILARLLTPTDYGLIGMIMVFIAISVMFIDSGFGLAYIQKKDADDFDASTIFYFNLSVSIFFFVILWLSAPLIANFYEETQLVNLLRVLSIVLVINSFGLIQRTKLTKNVDFRKKTILMLISSVVSGACAIIMALMNYGVWSLVAQSIVKALIESIGLFVLYKWTPLAYFSVKSLKSMLSFSSWALLMGIVSTIFKNIYLIVIGKFFPAAQLGFYTKAKQFDQTLSQTMSHAVGTVAFPVFSKLQEDKTALKNAMRKFTQHTLFFVVPLSAIFFVMAKPFFLILLTEKWLPMVPYFQVLLMAGVLYPIHMVNVQALTSQGKMKLNFNLSMIRNILRIINIIIMFRFGVIYIIYGEVICSFLGLLINTYYSKRLVNYGFVEQVKDVYVIFFISIILSASGIFLMNEINNDYLKIAFTVFFVVIFYVIAMYYLNRTLLFDNLEIVKSKIKRTKKEPNDII